MIFILDSVNNMNDLCNSFILFQILYVIKKSLTIIQIAGPIITMVALTINFIKLLTNPEEKKYMKNVQNCLIATVILFLMPVIINITMGLLPNTTTVGECWQSVEKNSSLFK